MTLITSVSEFLSALKDHVKTSAHGDLAIYRGQRDKEWPLLPSIARDPFTGADAICSNPDDGSGDKSAERRLLIVIRDYGVAHFPTWVWHGRPEDVRWKQIVVAQHYGLPTRLLDWTTNPLAALYFAVAGKAESCKKPTCSHCSSDMEHPSVVSALIHRDTCSVTSLATHNPRPPLYYGKHDPGLIRPPEIDSRISAQGSMFSIRKNPLDPIRPDVDFEILVALRGQILKELDELGVNRRNLFPDLQGVAEYLKWNVQFWKPNPGVTRA